jgi:hypothetical protein
LLLVLNMLLVELLLLLLLRNACECACLLADLR